jgi:hypothetical protein
MKYSLWKLETESVYRINAVKVRDTNSSKEVDKWINQDFDNVASFYREESEVNADHLQTFSND